MVLNKKSNASSRIVATKLTRQEFDRITSLVLRGDFLNVSDFVRTAVREKLGFGESSRLSGKVSSNVEKEILKYYNKHEEVVPITIANELNLDYKLVHEILDKLKSKK